jgi:hypothetical protein
MYHDLPHTVRFWLLVLAFGQDLDETARNEVRPCGERLQRSIYLRKPRQGPAVEDGGEPGESLARGGCRM